MNGWRGFGIYSVMTGLLTLALVIFLYLTFAPSSALSALHIGGLSERLLLVDRDIWYAVLGWLFFSRASAPSAATPPRQRFSRTASPSWS